MLLKISVTNLTFTYVHYVWVFHCREIVKVEFDPFTHLYRKFKKNLDVFQTTESGGKISWKILFRGPNWVFFSGKKPSLNIFTNINQNNHILWFTIPYLMILWSFLLISTKTKLIYIRLFFCPNLPSFSSCCPKQHWKHDTSTLPNIVFIIQEKMFKRHS